MSHHGSEGMNLANSLIDYGQEKTSRFFNQPEDFQKKLLSDIMAKQEPRNPYQPPEDIGATGEFPDGKLNEKDEGGIKFGCAIHEGRLIMNFGEKPITWIGFTKAEAKDLAEYILTKIEEIK